MRIDPDPLLDEVDPWLIKQRKVVSLIFRATYFHTDLKIDSSAPFANTMSPILLLLWCLRALVL